MWFCGFKQNLRSNLIWWWGSSPLQVRQAPTFEASWCSSLLHCHHCPRWQHRDHPAWNLDHPAWNLDHLAWRSATCTVVERLARHLPGLAIACHSFYRASSKTILLGLFGQASQKSLIQRHLCKRRDQGKPSLLKTITEGRKFFLILMQFQKKKKNAISERRKKRKVWV